GRQGGGCQRGGSDPHADGPAARHFQQVGPAGEMLFLGVADPQTLRLILGDPFDEGTEARRGRRGIGQARSEFFAAAEVKKLAALYVGFSRLNVPESSS